VDNWKTDRRVQFAIGLAVVLVAAKWLFTGDLFYAAVDMTQQPADGQTQTGVASSAVLPILVDILVGGLVFVGGWVLNLGELLIGRIQTAINPPAQLAASQAVSQSSNRDAVVAVDMAGTLRQSVISLGDAAAINDLDAMERLRVQIRKPFALAALNEAYGKGDTDAASLLVAELNKMHESASTKRKGVSNGRMVCKIQRLYSIQVKREGS